MSPGSQVPKATLSTVQGSVTVFYKGADGKYLRPCRVCHKSLCKCWILPVYGKVALDNTIERKSWIRSQMAVLQLRATTWPSEPEKPDIPSHLLIK